MEPQVEMHVIVKGNVQGVGFRSMTRHHALELCLKGTVRNLPDETVEIYAQGYKELLQYLITLLSEDTFPGQVEEATIKYAPIKTPYDDFRIIH